MSRKRHQRHPVRRALLIVTVCVIALGTGVALTTPRDLPAAIADHPATRTVYAWRDDIAARIHAWMYPLASLRKDAPDTTSNTTPNTTGNTGRAGTGYSKNDRKKLDQLIDTEKAPAP